MAERPLVAAVRCEDYAPERVEEAVRRAVDLVGGIGRYVRPGQRVALKPNLLRAMPPEAGVTTHPSVVRAVARLVQEAGATAVIAESPGGPFSALLLRRAFDKTGMSRVAEETGAELSFDTAVRRVDNPEGGLLRLVEVISSVASADAVINLPKLKTHNLTRLTVAVKNMFGVIPGVTKMGYHAKLRDAHAFSRGLVDIARCVRPVLTVTDAVVAMDGNGPSGGDLFDGQVLLASPDPIATDVVAVALVGWDPFTVPTIKVAAEWGLTTGRLEDVELRGDPFDSLRFHGFRPGAATAVDPGLVPRRLLRFVSSALALRAFDGTPVAGHDLADESIDVGTVPSGIRGWATRQLVVSPQAGPKCTGCGYCAERCPVDAIRIEGRRAHMDQHVCIRCYCCHELCPQLAVELRRPWLGRLLFGE